LKGTPYKLNMAEDSCIAVEKLCTGTYGLVFMDIQMPMMEGHQATEVSGVDPLDPMSRPGRIYETQSLDCAWLGSRNHLWDKAAVYLF
jgi:hypothetical protein